MEKKMKSIYIYISFFYTIEALAILSHGWKSVACIDSRGYFGWSYMCFITRIHFGWSSHRSLDEHTAPIHNAQTAWHRESYVEVKTAKCNRILGFCESKVHHNSRIKVGEKRQKSLQLDLEESRSYGFLSFLQSAAIRYNSHQISLQDALGFVFRFFWMQKKDEKRIFSSPGTSPCRDHKFAATTLQVNLAPRFKAFSWPVHPSWRQAKPPQNLIPFCTFPEIHQKKVVGVMVFSNCKVSCSTHKLLKGQLRYVYI